MSVVQYVVACINIPPASNPSKRPARSSGLDPIYISTGLYNMQRFNLAHPDRSPYPNTWILDHASGDKKLACIGTYIDHTALAHLRRGHAAGAPSLASRLHTHACMRASSHSAQAGARSVRTPELGRDVIAGQALPMPLWVSSNSWSCSNPCCPSVCFGGRVQEHAPDFREVSGDHAAMSKQRRCCEPWNTRSCQLELFAPSHAAEDCAQ